MAKVSVIIPTYNRLDLVQRTIDSALEQTYRDYEIIVIDDGSIDGTSEALQARYGDRIHVLTQANQGESAARNRGIAYSTGTYLALLDSDDLWLPNKLAKEVAALEADETLGMVFCQSWLIDEHDQLIANQPEGAGLNVRDITLVNLCRENLIGGPSTTLMKRQIFENVGGFDDSIRYGEDWDLWLRIAAQHRVGFISEPLTCIRRHRGTQCYYPSAAHNAQRFNDHLRLLQKTFAVRPGEISTAIQQAALAQQHAEAFLAEWAVHSNRAAQDHLAQVRHLSPTLLQQVATFGQMIVNYTAVIAEGTPQLDLTPATTYLAEILQQVRSSGPAQSEFERIVDAQATATLGFIAYQRGAFKAARHYYWRAMRRDSRWRHDRGAWSIIVKTVMGPAVLQSLRRLRARQRTAEVSPRPAHE